MQAVVDEMEARTREVAMNWNKIHSCYLKAWKVLVERKLEELCKEQAIPYERANSFEKFGDQVIRSVKDMEVVNELGRQLHLENHRFSLLELMRQLRKMNPNVFVQFVNYISQNPVRSYLDGAFIDDPPPPAKRLKTGE